MTDFVIILPGSLDGRLYDRQHGGRLRVQRLHGSVHGGLHCVLKTLFYLK